MPILSLLTRRVTSKNHPYLPFGTLENHAWFWTPNMVFTYQYHIKKKEFFVSWKTKLQCLQKKTKKEKLPSHGISKMKWLYYCKTITSEQNTWLKIIAVISNPTFAISDSSQQWLKILWKKRLLFEPKPTIHSTQKDRALHHYQKK